MKGPSAEDIPGLSSTPDDNDNDGDEIPDDQDDFPDVCTKLAITSYGASAAWVSLNKEVIVGPNNFHNEDEITFTAPP